ncbi:MAG: hypothetical protein KDD44_14590, partial [Bdellovibrionales bacterium]|nr:hypothetical protein [Bdellovibrionales bacterium]
ILPRLRFGAPRLTRIVSGGEEQARKVSRRTGIMPPRKHGLPGVVAVQAEAVPRVGEDYDCTPGNISRGVC